MRSNKTWTPMEDAYLIEHYSYMTIVEIALYLGRSTNTVQYRVNKRLRLRKKISMCKWSDEDIIYLKANWNKKNIDHIAEHLDKNVDKINEQMFLLGLCERLSTRNQGKYYRKCLKPDDADRMELFLRLLISIKRIIQPFHKKVNIDLWQMKEAFVIAERNAI